MASNPAEPKNTPVYELEEVVITATPDIRDFNISDFISRVDGRGGLAYSNKFLAQFDVDGIDYWCESAEFPGRSFTTSDSRIYGAVYKTPYETHFPEVNLTFLCDAYLSQKVYFDTWMEQINPPTTGGRWYGGGNRSFDFSYRQDDNGQYNYLKDVRLLHYAPNGAVTYGCMLVGAYPISVAALQANWGDEGFHKLQVTLTYEFWEPY